MHLNLTYADVLKIVTAKQACEYLLRNGKPLTVLATGKYLRELTGSYMGKKYPQSRKGLEATFHDLERLEAAIRAARQV